MGVAVVTPNAKSDPGDSIPFPGSSRQVSLNPESPTAGVAGSAATDARLLAEIAAGHAGSLAELYRSRGGAILALLVRMLGDTMEAEEVLQDTFVRIWQRAGTYQAAQSGPLTWMILLARGLAIERLRTRARRATLRATVASESVEPEWFQPEATSTADGFSALASREQSGRVEDALSGLPAEQRLTLELAFFKGCTQEEIAHTTGQPLGTVKARIRRGMLALRRRLKGIHE
jgi:RNA polymerase sigma-70 factor, ECF subfamily